MTTIVAILLKDFRIHMQRRWSGLESGGQAF